MRKYISLILLSIVCIMTGCDSNSEYIRDTSKGRIVEISLQEWEEKMENNDSFLVVFSQLYCNSCNEMHAMLDNYLPNHNITIYEIILDYETGTQIENQERINIYIDNFNQTPGVYYINNGKKEDQLLPQDTVQEEIFDEFIKKHQIDKKD